MTEPADDSGPTTRSASPARDRLRTRLAHSGSAHALALVWQADRRGTLWAAGMQLFGAASALATVYASKLALQSVLDKHNTGDARLVLALVLLAAVTALAGAAGALQSQQQRLLSERVTQHIWRRLLRACAAVDLATYQSNRFVRRLERVEENALDRPSTVVSALFGMAGSVVSVVAVTGALFAINPLLPPILLSAGIPALLVARRSSRTEFAFVEDAVPIVIRRYYLKTLLTSRPYAAETRAFGAAPELFDRHRRDDAEFLAKLRTVVRRRQLQGLVTTSTAGVALALTLIAIIALVRTNHLSLAGAGAAAIAARLLGGQLGTVFASAGTLIESSPFLTDLVDFVSHAPPIAQPPPPRPLRDRLDVTGVCFSYDRRASLALDDVSVSVGAGQVVAVVGENGSGKTTLSRVIAGLYAPDRGQVRWDGDATILLPELRASVSAIFQDFIHYQLSVLDNIAISDTSCPADRQKATNAADRVGLTSAIAGLPQGMDTVLGLEVSEGSDLSGGQWQRIALARALYRDSDLIVLDEPTAALDPRAEHRLFADVRTLLDGRAALLISHRYSSVRLADYIYVMHAGRVVEQGTHDDLMRLQGRYAELYTLQAAGFGPAHE